VAARDRMDPKINIIKAMAVERTATNGT